jgi:hypothetical protein
MTLLVSDYDVLPCFSFVINSDCVQYRNPRFDSYLQKIPYRGVTSRFAFILIVTVCDALLLRPRPTASALAAVGLVASMLAVFGLRAWHRSQP